MYKEKCGGDPILGETILCQEAKEYYNLIFTCCIISSVGLHLVSDDNPLKSVGIIVFGILDVKLGLFWTRLLGNLMTTVGLVLLTFYRQSGYYIMACFWLISAPAVYYTTSNLAIVSFFPKISGSLLILLPSMMDMSSGLFLLFKLAYENLDYDLVTMIQILTASSSLVWVRAISIGQFV